MNIIIKKEGNLIEIDDENVLNDRLNKGSISLRDLYSIKGENHWIPLYRKLKKNPFESIHFYIARKGCIIDKFMYEELKLKINKNLIFKTDYYWIENSDDWKLISELKYEESKFFIIIFKEGIEFGPYSKGEINSLLIENKISMFDLCWLEGLNNPVQIIYLFKYLDINPIYPLINKSGVVGYYSLDCILHLFHEGYLTKNDYISEFENKKVDILRVMQCLEIVRQNSKNSDYLEILNQEKKMQ